MKKILSIAAISVFTTTVLSLSAGAAGNCTYSFDSFVERLKQPDSLKCTVLKVSESFCDEIDETIKELLKDCECKFFDCFPALPDIKPDEDKPESDVPEQDAIPEKPETEYPEQEVTPDKPSDDFQENKPNDNIQNDNSQGTENGYVKQILDLVNKERAANGLAPVTASNKSLSSAAQKRATEQAINFSHTRPDGRSWTTVLSEFGVSYRSAGENVAYGQSSPAEVMNAWMNSSGHRANILNAAYSEIGIGVYKKNGTYYWSQLFIG